MPETILRSALVACVLAASAVHAAPAGRSDPPGQAQEVLERAKVEINGGRRDRGFAILDSLLAVAVSGGDETLRLTVVVAKGGHRAWGGEAREADALLRPALRAIEARKDTALFLRAALWEGKALLDLGRFSDADSIHRRLLAVATHLDRKYEEGWAHLGLALGALESGHPRTALDHYASARSAFVDAADEYGELEALTGLGRAYGVMGDVTRALATYREVVDRARRTGWKRSEAYAHNNVGCEEFCRGDPGAALGEFREACRLWNELGNRRGATIPTANAALALSSLGRMNEAAGVLDSLVQVCRAEGFADAQAAALSFLGGLNVQNGEFAAAEDAYREIIQLGDEVPVAAQLEARQGFAQAAADLQGPAVGLAALDDPTTRRLRAQASPDLTLDHDTRRALFLLKLGRNRESYELAEQAASTAEPLRRADSRMLLLSIAARARLAEGNAGEALRDALGAGAAWEKVRVRPSDAEWRACWGDAERVTSTLIQAILAQPKSSPPEDRLRAAFDVSQRFKARSLAERIQRGRSIGDSLATPSLERVQREILRPGELLIDAFSGPDSTFVFFVSRDRCALVRLPGAVTLQKTIGLLYRLVSSAPSTDEMEHTAAVDEVTARLAGFWPADAAEMLEEANTILFSPDGALQMFPLDLWPGPLPAGASEAGGRMTERDALPPQRRLGLASTVARVPSIALLARERSNAPLDAPGGADHGLVLCGSADSIGRTLAGVKDEARALARRFRDFKVRTAIDGGEAESTAWRSTADVLHFAAHTHLDTQYPWRSGIEINAADKPGAHYLLRADRIASAPARARLVVISGCASATGRVLGGEGIQGLSTAFLAAGATSVVATLWPVDDQATARLMVQFYDQLARGIPAGAALRNAKAAMARSRQYASPFYWAGFVLIGEPDLRLHLCRRVPSTLFLVVALAIAVPAAGLVFAARRRPRQPSGKKSVIPKGKA